MANRLEVMKNFHLTYGELILFTNSLATVLQRDILDMADYGVTTLKIEAMLALKTTFENLPNDETLRSELGYAVEMRDIAWESVLKIMRSIAVRSKSVFGENSAKYRALNAGTISQMPESEIILAARQVYTAAVENKTELAPEGVTDAYPANFESDIDALETAIQEVVNKKNNRDDMTQHKIETGNKLYELISKYCDYGKTLYENNNPARYNDYVIYSVPAGSLKAPGYLVYSQATNEFNIGIVENATSYQLEYSPDGNEFVEIYSGANPTVTMTPPSEGWSYYRARARNANGFGPFSDVAKIGFYINLPAPTNPKVALKEGSTNEIIFTFDEVITATVYYIQHSIVPIGNVPAGYLNEGSVTTNCYTAEVITGKRHYYRCYAMNPWLTSPESTNCFVDVVA